MTADSSGILLGDYLDDWLETSVKPTVRDSTYRLYRGHVKHHITPFLGGVSVVSLNPQQVQLFINTLSEGDLSNATIHRIRGTLRKALNQAQVWGMVDRNVATLVSLPKEERKRFEPMTPEQLQKLLKQIEGDRLEVLYTLALSTGMRIGEVLGLQWEDIDFDRRVIHIRNQLGRQEGTFVLSPPKTPQSRRTIPLPQEMVDALRAHKSTQLEEGITAWDGGDLVFRTSKGGPFDGPNVTRYLQRHAKEAGLPRIRFHDLRHACATFLLAQGVELQVVKEILGHSQISLTADTYAHVLPSLKEDATERLRSVIWGGNDSNGGRNGGQDGPHEGINPANL